MRLAGAIDHAADRRAQQLRKPIAEHVADFKKDFIARQNTEKHVKDTIGNIELIIEKGEVEFIRDLTSDKVTAAIGHLRLHGKEPRKVNPHKKPRPISLGTRLGNWFPSP